MGCPEGQVLEKEPGDSCCSCAPLVSRAEGKEAGGIGRGAKKCKPRCSQLPELLQRATALQEPGPAMGEEEEGSPSQFPLVTYLLPLPGDPCYAPLGLARLPASSLSPSSQQADHPAAAGHLGPSPAGPDLQGWSPQEDVYPEMHARPPFLQIDLLQPHNLTGIVVQGAGSSDAYITSFSLQFSADGLHWHDYPEAPGLKCPFQRCPLAQKGWLTVPAVLASCPRPCVMGSMTVGTALMKRVADPCPPAPPAPVTRPRPCLAP
ncbi:SCO-spondin-like [Tachyglossus aculeatus]|uniref:SCO-spondin-like n=1 Tax=Tachyglossus aculeatus TaxID=9261 RepID=UPI0018F3C09C|nr:SCO-spondin-like [Tachyglossus aculeatus]